MNTFVRRARFFAHTTTDEDGKGQPFDSETMNILIICMGVMYGAAGANNALKAMAKALAAGVEKQPLRKALTKGTIYPIVKSVAKWFSVKMTKEVFTGFFKKRFRLWWRNWRQRYILVLTNSVAIN